jgi:hypothetical protein
MAMISGALCVFVTFAATGVTHFPNLPVAVQAPKKAAVGV